MEISTFRFLRTSRAQRLASTPYSAPQARKFCAFEVDSNDFHCIFAHALARKIYLAHTQVQYRAAAFCTGKWRPRQNHVLENRLCQPPLRLLLPKASERADRQLMWHADACHSACEELWWQHSKGGCREEDGGVANLEDRLEECPEEYSTSYAQGEPDAHGPAVNSTHAHKISNCGRCRCQAACINIGEFEPRRFTLCCRAALSVTVMQHSLLSTLESPLLLHG